MPEITTSTGSAVFYRKMGTGPAMVLLHGFPESGLLWRYVWDALSESFTLIIPDFPGSGNSPLINSVSLNEMAGQIKSILDAEEVNKAVIAGHSMGGYVALAFADQFPEHVAGLSLVHSTPAADDDEKKVNRTKAIEIVNRGGRDTFLKQMIPNLFAEDFKREAPLMVKEQLDNALNMPAESITNFYTAMMQRPERIDVLHEPPFAVQWIIGTDDTLIPWGKVVQFLHRADINFISVYEGCGHMAMIEAPDKLASDLKIFTRYCYS